MMVDRIKPLNRKSYGSIPHLTGSKTSSPKDIGFDVKGTSIFTIKTKRKTDHVIVTEKLDGSCCAVLKQNGKIIALGKAGFLAQTSQYEMHHVFARWVANHEKIFSNVLNDGERFVGEWLAQAHGTRYDLTDRSPFVIFDLMIEDRRFLYVDLMDRVKKANNHLVISLAPILCDWHHACGVDRALKLLGNNGHYGAIDPAEGCVWRIERDGKCLTLAKWVRCEKDPGCYLATKEHPEIAPIWNWSYDR